ncbi:hypothetical protein CHQ84_04385 [Francisella noatunensis subsp. orientalis]|nr:hypothetical protein M973_08460 [Francisella orientalis LADL 07-285A]APD41718.1 hypothetical protein BMT43_07465 [Francisella orientalis]NIB62024.1 hypothetical protein [Francisella orientalis]NIB65524.1 hypothetical protein [Francisella orientalis]NIY50655.1 hypothetical protein [Francisella orientalis]
MEVETNFKSILKDNHIVKNRYNTNDYVKLNDLMSLGEYEVRFTAYNEYSSINPFKNWNQNRPTVSLTWYYAYNSTKLDREENFSKASFENAISAVAGLIVLLYSQLGRRVFDDIDIRYLAQNPEKVYLAYSDDSGNFKIVKKDALPYLDTCKVK